jgi:nucleoside phosphorylase
MGLFRSRAPLALVLFVAAREGRLVWRGEDSYALLEAPLTRPLPRRYGGVWHSLLRLVDRRWEMVVFAAPPALALLLALVFALLLVLTAAPVGPLLIPAMLLIVLAVGYVTVPLVTQFLFGLLRVARRVAGGRADHSADDLPSGNWSMPFCHHADSGGSGDELIGQVGQRLHRLVVAYVQASAWDLGSKVPTVVPTQTLGCLLDGITTARMRAVVGAAAEASPTGSVAIIAAPAGDRRRRPRPEDPGDFLVLYLVAMAIVVAVESVFVADWEQDACPDTACPGRPTSYALAIRWLAQRLLFTDPPNLSPVTTPAWVVGWLTSFMALMAVPVFVVSIRQARRSSAQHREAFEATVDIVTQQARVLILVAAHVEWDAVVAAASERGARPPARKFVKDHTVFTLGSLGGTTVLLAQCEQGTLSPAASTLTAQSLIDQLQPNYLILTGICYGLWENHHRIGDVLVGNQLRVIDHKRVVDVMGPDDHPGGDRVEEFLRGDWVSPPTILLDRCRSATADWRWPAAVHFGPILSGNVLVDSAVLRSRLADRHPEAIGGEMEGAGVYAAAAKGRTEWIVVKAISDWGSTRRPPIIRSTGGSPPGTRLASCCT